MSDKQKTQSDAQLIKKLFGIDPLDWARYPDSRLVFISPTGQKFSYSKEQLEALAKSSKSADASPAEPAPFIPRAQVKIGLNPDHTTKANAPTLEIETGK